MTSPTTLVCTSTDYSTTIQGVSWYNGKFLVDPIEYLNDTEKQVLAGWTNSLKSSLLDHPGIDTQMQEFDSLLSSLDKYIEDLGGVKVDIEFSSDTLKMKEGIFKYLDKPIYISDERVQMSHLRIRSSKEPAPEKSLLVVDKEIAKQWNIPEKDISVFRGIPLDRITPGTLSGKRDTLLNTSLEGDRWSTPAEYFTKKLFLIKQKNALSGIFTINGSENLFYQDVPVTPLIPLTDLILPYLETMDMANRLRIEQVEDDITVTLSIPLTGADGTGKDFLISKTFHAKENEIQTLTSVPILDIWPNFTSENWKAYYTYFSNAGDEKTFYAAPWDNSESKRTFANSQGQVEREIYSLDHFSEILECKTYEIDKKNKKPVPRNAGIILVQKPEPIKPTPETFKIGVDFGTSGSNVYSQHGKSKPKKVTLSDRFFKVSAPSEGSRTELFDYFLPGIKMDMPFLSVFHDFRQEKKGQRPLLDGHIYFLLDHKDFNAAKEDIKTDLKWGDKIERSMARAFLEQLCMQCSAEAAADLAQKISWCFSYPTAFSSEDEEAFVSIWNQIADKNQKQTGIESIGEEPIYKSESIASASYFANNDNINAPISKGAVFIDIGGGTSDISIWQGKNVLKMQTSLMFAGRDLFSYPLWKKTDFLKNFCDENEMASLKKEELQAKKIAFYAQLDAIVSAQGESMLQKLPNVSNEPDVKGFKQLIALGLSGLFFYIGLVLKKLTDSGSYKKKLPNFYFGGNGSRLMHWLAAGNFKPNSAINHLFKAVFSKAYGTADGQKFEIQVSPEPKAEVSYGLVTDYTPLNFDEDKMKEGFYLAGEDFESKGKKYNWDSQLTTKEIKAGIVIPEDKLNQFKTFLEIFNKSAKKAGIIPVSDDADLMEKTLEQVNQAYANLTGKGEDTIHIEPIFITALKKLLAVKVDEWKNK
jgi:hypothetical protein